MNPRWSRGLAVILFALGLVLGMALTGIIVWGDMEATVFDAAISPEATLTTLRCPILITSAETSTVSASFHNPADRQVTFLVQAHISQGFVTLMREAKTSLTLAPGETQRLEWAVTPADAAFRSVILVRVHALRSGPLPYRAGSCGIVVLPFPYLRGNALLAVVLAVTLLGTGGGIALWVANNHPLIRRSLTVLRGMGVLAGIMGVALVLGLLGVWLIGLVLLLFAVLLIVVMAAYLAVAVP